MSVPKLPRAQVRRLQSSLETEPGELPGLVFPHGYVPGISAAMRKLHSDMAPLARRDFPVLITGETGVGKELVARTFHLSSPRHRGPFAAINCAAVPAGILEAELFGVGDRVATGVARNPGQFRRAEGGTLFLDEIGEMAHELQAKLLRTLQEKEVYPLGSPPVSIDVRVVAATNADISTLMIEGRFRRDLYYRLAGSVLRVPPLRERREDIPLLVERFLQRLGQEISKPLPGITSRALCALSDREWPGNVRELENAVSRLVYLCPPGREIEHGMLVEQDGSDAATAGPDPAGDAAGKISAPRRSPLRNQPSLDLAALEREAVTEALRRGGGKQVMAAKLLGISRFSLRRKLERFGLFGPRPSILSKGRRTRTL